MSNALIMYLFHLFISGFMILSVGYSDRSDNPFVSYFVEMVWGSSKSVRVILFLYLRVNIPYTVYLM